MNSGKRNLRLWGRWIAVAILSVCECRPSDSSTLEAVRVTHSAGAVSVQMELDSPVQPSVGRLRSPERLYLDFENTSTRTSGVSQLIPVEDPLLRQVRVGSPRTQFTRVVLELSAESDYTVRVMRDPPRVIVELGIPASPPGRERRVFRLPAPAPPVSRELEILPAPPPIMTAAKPESPPVLEAILIKPWPAASAEGTFRIERVLQPPRIEQYTSPGQTPPGVRVAGFRQRVPADGAPASQETAAYLAYDSKNLYIAFVCRDEPGQVRAHLSKREDIGEDDRVAVYLDTFHDRRRAYVFAANPLGVQRDEVLTEGQPADPKFEAVWHTEGRPLAEGYAVLFRIPLNSIRFPRSAVQEWGIALRRSIVRRNEESYWPYITDRIPSFLRQTATLAGFEGISPGRFLQATPYGTFAHLRSLDSDQARYQTLDESRGGADFKYVHKDAVTIDATVNPDFSQVESDDPQVTINQRFEVFFPERRPFFLENAGFFETPTNLLFTRRIGDPKFGARATGKVGRWAFGVLNAYDRAPGRRLAEDDPLHNRLATVSVARIQREIGSQSMIGLFVSDQEFGTASNRVVAVDSRFRLRDNWILTGQLMRSYDENRNGRRLSGAGLFASLARAGRSFNSLTSYTDFSPDFRTSLGFVRRVDIRTAEQYLGYRWWTQGKRLLGFGPSATGMVNYDRTGRLQDWYVYGDFALEFTRQTQIKVARFENYEYYLGRGFRKWRNDGSFYTAWWKWMSLSATYGQGQAINYSPGGGLPSFLGDATDASFVLSLRPTPRLRLDQTYLYSRLRGGRDPWVPVREREGIYTNHLFRTRVNFQFTRALSLRVIGDYYGVLPNPSLVILDKFKRLTGDVLLTYLLSPGTALYVGYTDRFDNLAFVPGVPGSITLIPEPRTSTGRQFFVKVSRAFRF